MRKRPRDRSGYDPNRYIPASQAAGVQRRTTRKPPRYRDGYNADDYVPASQVGVSVANTMYKRVRTDSDIPETPTQTIPKSGPSNSALHYKSSESTKRRKLSHIVCPGPAYPLSAYEGGDSHPPISSERDALKDLLKAHGELHAEALEPPEYVYCELGHFSIYKPDDVRGNARYRGELVTLDRLLRYGDGCETYVFDGILSCGQEQRWVQGVHFNVMAIAGYGEDSMDPAVEQSITIQSKLASHINVWYRLGVPSTEYTRFYQPFIWLVQFTRFFADYLLETECVTLDHFKRDGQFATWLRSVHGRDSRFAKWHADCGNLENFRTSVAANIGFLHKECYSIASVELGKHPIWSEVDPLRLDAIPARDSIHTKTVVTPFVRRCFQDMYFARKLVEIEVTNSEIRAKVQQLKARHQLTPWSHENGVGIAALPTPQSLSPGRSNSPDPLDVRAGDVVAIEPDVDGHWKSSDDVWYAYVQRVRQNEKSGEAVLDVLWLYRPSDTTLGAASNYPFPNELFLSDNCSCRKEAIPLHSVLAKVKLAWNVIDPSSATTLFVRRKFRTVHEDDHYSFETIDDADYTCLCSKPICAWDDCLAQYRLGDTVLVLLAGGTASPVDGVPSNDSNNETESEASIGRADFLEPAQIVNFDHATHRILIRLFVSRDIEEPAARKNELSFSDKYRRITPSSIARKCYMLVLGLDEHVPAPYDRNGAGDCYYLRSKPIDSDGERRPESIKLVSPPLNQGWDPRRPRPKLRGLGIFCGGGNFDRGLEDGGAVDFKYAVDWAEHALHSYRANARHADAKYYLGSVDDYLASAIQGAACDDVAGVGDLDVISAGSPCPGFSDLQTNKYSEQSLKNASMVASVLAYVDFYVPTYLILENVVSMTRSMGVDKKQNVFSQMLATLVAMGYQVQQFLMDAWTVGSSEQRSRLFIVASAPGVQPLPTPPHTHDHPASTEFRLRSLGRCANGLSFGTRRNDWTPFQCTTIADSCADLPSIGDAQVQLCPAFPDHRTPLNESGASRSRIALIPTRPAGQSLALAVAEGRISGGEPQAYFQRLGPLAKKIRSKSFSRVYADRLMPTVITVLCPRCAKTGRVLHWCEHRILTLMECRRAQGFPDDEVLVGSPFQQMKIIGNSVNRYVALALGMSLREAWSKTMTSNPLAASFASESSIPLETCTMPHESEAPLKKRIAMVVLPSQLDTKPKKQVKHVHRDRLEDNPVVLSSEQVQNIRKHGFDAMLQMLRSREHLDDEEE
ncbi:hypothetical protein LTR78_008293 [Recurvomyces mirabilis]|uniref:DNA (cytosine-5-)-methyltransferase n=1 Tax=Recurvomyces mirabilis TaxID=574656 RepID=A0AAE0TTA8_9PEZI|nr:hypothetical protein LTR78_008293 [Recurvomyces mirabilis]KAK5158582.1 hypothetical protein LTS14_003602 [Recurvomyces mirabilis]